MSSRRVFAGRCVVAFARPRDGPPRVGVAVSRQVKGAVSRNRARRRLREAARLVLLADGWESAEGGITYDVVLIARPATLAISFDQLTREIAAVRDRLAAP